jgi:hypothetical protein
VKDTVNPLEVTIFHWFAGRRLQQYGQSLSELHRTPNMATEAM